MNAMLHGVMGALLVFATITAFAQEAASEKENFPTTEEITLVVGQAETAFNRYKLSVDREATLPQSIQDKSGVAKDRQLLSTAVTVIKGLKKKPEVFHGLGGLLLLSQLDDASRNAVLCASQSNGEAALNLLSQHDAALAQELLATAQQCMDASTLLYSVSESVHALLVREVESQDILNGQAIEALNRCKEIVNNRPHPRK